MDKRKKAALPNTREEAIALASQMIIDFITDHGEHSHCSCGEPGQLGYFYRLLSAARTRIGAEAELRISRNEDNSIPVTAMLLEHLRELDEVTYELVAVDIPGGASVSRLVQ